MKNTIYELETFKEVIRLATNLYRLGWDERNGGNISIILKDDEADKVKDFPVIRTYKICADASALAGKYFIVTGTGKYFKNVEYQPEINLGLIRINKDGSEAELLYGLADGNGPTSELPSHLLSHISRLEKDKNHRAVIHTHPTNVIAMTLMIEEDEDVITKALWKMQTESIVVFPEGIGYLPWMVCGGKEIGSATAEKAKDYRAIIWGMHGIFGMGNTLDEAFGLIETIEKAAQIWVLTKGAVKQEISDTQLKELAKTFRVHYKEII